MKFKLRQDLGNLKAGTIFSVDPYIYLSLQLDEPNNFTPHSIQAMYLMPFEEDQETKEIKKESPHGQITVHQEMKSLNIEFK